MSLYFNISELCIDPNAGVPQAVADKILKYHLWPVNKVRLTLGAPVWASSRSCWRPKSWERAHGRDPETSDRSEWSRHTFTPTQSGKDEQGKGAADWTTIKSIEKMRQLARLLYNETDYTRLCWYPDYDEDDIEEEFIHCDYGWPDRGKRVFINDSGWQEVESLDKWIQQIEL